jgi:hypothetical protein
VDRCRPRSSRSGRTCRSSSNGHARSTPDSTSPRLTIGENSGDLGCLTIAYKAYKLSLRETEPPVLDTWTGDQRFFIGWARIWRAKYRDAELMRRLAIDPHSPTEFRCNGVVQNLPEFYAAFGVARRGLGYPDRRSKSGDRRASGGLGPADSGFLDARPECPTRHPPRW